MCRDHVEELIVSCRQRNSDADPALVAQLYEDFAALEREVDAVRKLRNENAASMKVQSSRICHGWHVWYGWHVHSTTRRYMKTHGTCTSCSQDRKKDRKDSNDNTIRIISIPSTGQWSRVV